MAIAALVTRGFSNGSFSVTVQELVTFGYDIGVQLGPWTDVSPVATTWTVQAGASTTWTDQSTVTTTWTDT